MFSQWVRYNCVFLSLVCLFALCLLCHGHKHRMQCSGSPSWVFPANSLCHSGIFVLCCVSLTCEVQEIESDREMRLPLEFV